MFFIGPLKSHKMQRMSCTLVHYMAYQIILVECRMELLTKALLIQSSDLLFQESLTSKQHIGHKGLGLLLMF